MKRKLKIVVYYESIKRDLCRCDERLQTKTMEFTRLTHTGLKKGRPPVFRWGGFRRRVWELNPALPRMCCFFSLFSQLSVASAIHASGEEIGRSRRRRGAEILRVTQLSCILFILLCCCCLSVSRMGGMSWLMASSHRTFHLPQQYHLPSV
jgi:hypothetical protein